LEGFKNLLKEKPELHLVFVGREDYLYKKLKKHVEKNIGKDKVYFLENVDDERLSKLYKGAIALVRPSLMEGFSLPPLEAMENRCLVLASDIPVHREIFNDSIIYFDQFNTNDILHKMNYVLDLSQNEKENLIKKGLELTHKYSWSKTARETQKVYEGSLSL
jgi:glycosyltransferase involved in cell wall biosynthesis